MDEQINPNLTATGSFAAIAGSDIAHRRCADLVECHRPISVKALVLGCDLAGAVLELPRRIGEDSPELLAPRRGEQVSVGSERIRFRQ